MSACRVLRHRPAPARASSQQWLTACPMGERLRSMSAVSHPATPSCFRLTGFPLLVDFRYCVPRRPGQSTHALRTHAHRDKFTALPVWDSSPQTSCGPLPKTCHVALGVGFVRHPPGKCEPLTRKIQNKELEIIYLNEIKLVGFV